jgi:hypothetical protein
MWSGDFPWVSPKDMKTDLIADSEEHISEEGRKASIEAVRSRCRPKTWNRRTGESRLISAPQTATLACNTVERFTHEDSALCLTTRTLCGRGRR